MVKELTRKMKDSGVEWIGEIPEDWEVVRLKDKYIFEKGKNAGLYTKEYVGANIGNYPVYSGQTENKGIMGYIDSYEYDLKDSIYTTTVGAKVMTANMISGKISLSQNCVLFINRDENTDDRFVLNFLNPLFKYEKSMIPSYMQPSLRIEDLKRYIMFTPKIDEQKEIADFLDKKVSEIDNIISKTKKAIEEYKRYKQSLITETVTKGLDENVEMKDSGIEWIGEIPEHWQAIKLKYFYNIISGTTPTNKDENWNGEILWITPADYNTEDISIKDSKRKITKLGVENSSLSVIPIDSIIVSNRAPIGKIALNEKEVTINQGCKALVLKKIIDNKFTYYILSIYSDVLNMLGRGTTFLELSGRELSNFIISIPPLKEQEQIASYLDNKCSQIDQIISTKEKLLTEMEAYKKSLIYETVTGKREVE